MAVKVSLDMVSVTKSLKDFDKHLKNMQQMANQNVIRIQVSNANSQINETRRGLEGINTQTRSFTQNMGYAIKRVSQFALGFSLVYGAVKKVKDALGFMKDLDTQLTDIAIITGKSKEELQGYAKEWNDLAISTKTTTLEVASAFQTYLRAGKSVEQANLMVSTNIKLARIANDTNEETATKLIKISEAYDMNAEAVDRFANKVSYLDTTTASSTSGILKTANGVAEVGKQTKVSEDFMLSMIATIQERSGKAPESVSRALKGIFLDLQKVTSDMSEDGTKAVSKLEKDLTRFDISLRSNATTFKSNEDIIKSLMSSWGNFDDVTKRTIQNMIGGKNFAEEFNIIMGSQNLILDRANELKSTGNSLDTKYQEHLSSTQGKLNELKATQEKFYMSILNSTAINKTIGALTEIVKLIQYITVENKVLGASILVTAGGILLITRHMVGLKMAIGNITAFLALLKVGGLSAFGALMVNPVTLGLVAVAGALTAITLNLYKNHKIVKELTEGYKNLSEAINTADIAGQEQNIQQVKKLGDELVKLKEQIKNVGNETRDTGLKMGIQNQIDDITKKLKKAGFTINEVTGAVKELETAQSNINLSEKIKDIENVRDSESKRATTIQSLIDRYNSLNGIEKRSAIQQSELNVITKQLKDSIGELNVMEDKNGNLIITNNGILSLKRKALDDTKNMAVTSANAQIAKERELTQVIINGTSITLSELRKRVKGYASVIEAYSIDVNNAFAKGNGSTYINAKQTEAFLNAEKYKKILTEIDSSFNTISTPYTSDDGGNDKGYTPTGSSSSKEKDKVDKEDIANLETKKDKYYLLESALQSVEVELDRLSKLESNVNEEDKLKLKEKEIKLLDQKKISLQNIYKELGKENQLNADNLKNKGVRFDNQGNISNRNEILASKSADANSKTGDAKKLAQDNFKKFEESIKEYESIRFDKINDISAKIFNLEQDRLNVIKDTQEIVKSKIESLLNEEKQVAELKLENARDAKIAKYDEELKEFKKTHYAIIDGIDDEIKATEDLTKAKEESEERTKRQIELSKLQSKLNNLYVLQAKELELYNNKTKEQFEENIKVKNDALQSQINNINKVNKLEEEKETRLENQNDLIKLQTQLQNTQEQKNVRQLVKKDDGSFNFEYVADQSKIEEINQQIIEKQKSNADWEKQIADNKNIAILQSQIEANNKTVEENAKTLSLLEKQLSGTVDGILGQINSLNDEIIDKQKDNNKWELSLIESKNRERLENEKKAELELIKNKEEYYANEKIVVENAYKSESLLLTQHYADMDALVIVEMDKLKVTYGNKWGDILREVNANLSTMRAKNNEMMALQNSLSMGVTTGGGSSSEKYNVTVIDSEGNSQTKTMSSAEYNSSATQNELNGIRNIDGTVVRVVGMDTGGMTTDWSDGDSGNGKLVKLHPNEIVSNPLDTSKLLRASEFVSRLDMSILKQLPSMSDMINSTISKFNIRDMGRFENISNNKPVENHYNFGDISLPNVTNSNGAEDFVKGLKGFTSQLANNSNFMSRHTI